MNIKTHNIDLKILLRKVLAEDLQEIAIAWGIGFNKSDNKEKLINKILESDLSIDRINHLKILGEAYSFQTKASVYIYQISTNISRGEVDIIINSIGNGTHEHGALGHWRVVNRVDLRDSISIEIHTPASERTVIDYFDDEYTFYLTQTSIVNFHFDCSHAPRVEIFATQKKVKDIIRLLTSKHWFEGTHFKQIEMDHTLIHFLQEKYNARGTEIIQIDGADDYDEETKTYIPLAQSIKSAKYDLLKLRGKSQLFAEKCDVGIFLLFSLDLNYRKHVMHFEVNFDKNCINLIYTTPRDAYIKLMNIIDNFYDE